MFHFLKINIDIMKLFYILYRSIVCVTNYIV